MWLRGSSSGVGRYVIHPLIAAKEAVAIAAGPILVNLRPDLTLPGAWSEGDGQVSGSRYWPPSARTGHPR
jgi:hypothetical protein